MAVGDTIRSDYVHGEIIVDSSNKIQLDEYYNEAGTGCLEVSSINSSFSAVIVMML